MNRINSPKSRRSICNLFADFLLEKLSFESSSMIQVTDCKNFFVINGFTDSSTPLNIFELSDEFNEKYQKILEKKITHTFDFIKYNTETKPVDFFRKKFYLTSDNNSYHYSILDMFDSDNSKSFVYNGISTFQENTNSELSVCSEFPHGYSFSQGRTLYYYAKFMSYNLTGLSFCTEIDLGLYLNRTDGKENLVQIICKDGFSSDDLTSYLLDSFDFNYSSIENRMKNVDFSQEILNPTKEFNVLKKNISVDPFI